MPSVTPGSANERPQRLGEIVPGADEDEIPEQREPRRHERSAPTRASRLEQALAVFADGTPIFPQRSSCAGGLSQRAARARVMDNRFEAPHLGIQHALAVRRQREVPAPLVVFIGGRAVDPTRR